MLSHRLYMIGSPRASQVRSIDASTAWVGPQAAMSCTRPTPIDKTTCGILYIVKAPTASPTGRPAVQTLSASHPPIFSSAQLVHVREHELRTLFVHLVHLLRHDTVVCVVQGQEEAVHLHIALALDQVRRHGDGLGPLRVQLEGQLPRRALQAEDLAL